jgi:hypothetical protein
MPNYPTPMPTWYNLFLAAAALWLFFRYVETRQRWWLLGAGVACGLSLTVKIVGLYTVAGLLMALVMAEAGESEAEASEVGGGDGVKEPGHGASRGHRLFVLSGLAVYVLVVLLLVRNRLGIDEALHFVVPSVAAASLAAWRVWTAGGAEGSLARLRRLAGLVFWLVGGVILPVMVFSLPFLGEGAVGDLVHGTLVLPFRRLSFAASSPLPLSLAAPGLVLVALLVAAALTRGRLRWAILATLGAGMAVVLFNGGDGPVYLRSWGTFLLAPPLVVLAGSWGLARAWPRARDAAHMTKAGAVLAILASFTLVQYPMSGPVYFLYVAPLVIMAALVVWPRSPRWRIPGVAALAFAMLFPALWIGPASLMATAQGRFEWTRGDTVRLDIQRGGIRVTAEEAAEYRELTSALAALAPNGVAFATPDAPEVYFLAGLRNPTPVLYDFFDEQAGRTARTLDILEAEDVRVVVLNRLPHFSGPPADALLRALEERFPRATDIGRYIVR